MQDEEKHTMQPEESGSRKKKKGKTLLETMREIDEKEAQREAEAEQRRQEIIAEREKKEKEAYAKKIQQDRIELMRLKQGIIAESETIREEQAEKVKLSPWKKVSNFFYHSKWWLIITVFIVGIFTYLIVDQIRRVKPDMIVMVLTDDAEIQARTQQLETYFEQFTDDENGDGKVHVDIYPIPVNEDIGANDYYTGDATKLSSQFHLGDSVLVLTDTKANEFISADNTLQDLTSLYPNSSNARGKGYYLRHTDFAVKIEYPGNVDRDLALSLRTPIKTYDSLEDMQENYDIAKKVLDRIVESLDGTEEPEDIPATKATEEELS